MVKQSLLLISALISLAGCGEAPQEISKGPERAAPLTVTAVTAAAEDVPATYEASGTVRPRSCATISAKILGAVREVKVQLGDHVQEGQLLIVVDAREMETAVRRAEAARDEIKGLFPEAAAGVAAAKASLDLAQVTFTRMGDLYHKRSISNQEFDEASSHLKAAQSALDIAQAKRAQLDAKLEQAEQEVRAARVNQSYAEISAPFAGIIASKSVEPGNMAVPGVPLLTIDREGAYRVEASVEETRLRGVRLGQTVDVIVDGSPPALSGKVSQIVPEVDPASRTGTVKIDLPMSPHLRLGVFARVVFPAGSRRAVVVPAAALVEQGQLQSVFVVENGTAHTRLVTAGAATANRAEMLSGINAGETVIAPVPPNVKDGSPVEVRP